MQAIYGGWFCRKDIRTVRVYGGIFPKPYRGRGPGLSGRCDCAEELLLVGRVMAGWFALINVRDVVDVVLMGEIVVREILVGVPISRQTLVEIVVVRKNPGS